MKGFLKTRGTKIVLPNGKPVMLRGIALGGWLMMEGYMMYAPNIAEWVYKKNFRDALGDKELRSFEHQFRTNFVCEDDFRNIARMGFNCVRLPFNCRLIEKGPFKHDKAGVRFLDDALRWARQYKIWIILDMHAAPGCQNHDWHSDSIGKAELWTKKIYRDRTLALWQYLADRYKNEEYVAGYDLINESVVHDAKKLNRFYKKIIKAIRSVDKNHILFTEGNTWATDVECLDRFDDDNYALSVHSYEPTDFTFNYVPHLSYPQKGPGGWNATVMRRHLSRYQRVAKARKVPVFVGEFGVNARQGHYGEDRWLADILKCFNRFGFHWTYWTYKAVKNAVFPDGIYSYYPNPPWVNRYGPLTGWETFKRFWPKYQKHMARSWRTDQFRSNKEILKVLRDAIR